MFLLTPGSVHTAHSGGAQAGEVLLLSFIVKGVWQDTLKSRNQNTVYCILVW